MRILLIGQYAGRFPDEHEVFVWENADFGTDRAEVRGQVIALAKKAKAMGAEAIVFQSITNALAIALSELHRSLSDEWLPLERQLGIKVGVIISRLGPRLAGMAKEFVFATTPEGEYGPTNNPPTNAELVREVVAFANPRAKVTVKPMDRFTDLVRVEVNTVSSLILDHIEWM